ncbi:hypothetical protein [Prescottella equi]|uniref:hypothetical protein n=1 Tax=Rhodococcus hoagii TaxID=43767 RepID=UPI001EE9F179|nr:hypothetical protein [Prescottella equi]
MRNATLAAGLLIAAATLTACGTTEAEPAAPETPEAAPTSTSATVAAAPFKNGLYPVGEGIGRVRPGWHQATFNGEAPDGVGHWDVCVITTNCTRDVARDFGDLTESNPSAFVEIGDEDRAVNLEGVTLTYYRPR